MYCSFVTTCERTDGRTLVQHRAELHRLWVQRCWRKTLTINSTTWLNLISEQVPTFIYFLHSFELINRYCKKRNLLIFFIFQCGVFNKLNQSSWSFWLKTLNFKLLEVEVGMSFIWGERHNILRRKYWGKTTYQIGWKISQISFICVSFFHCTVIIVVKSVLINHQHTSDDPRKFNFKQTYCLHISHCQLHWTKI